MNITWTSNERTVLGRELVRTGRTAGCYLVVAHITEGVTKR